jgi:hypothetical protein
MHHQLNLATMSRLNVLSGEAVQIVSQSGTFSLRSSSAYIETAGVKEFETDGIKTSIRSPTTDIKIGDGQSGVVILVGGGATAGIFGLLEPSGDGTSYVGFKSPALAGNTVYDWPNAFPAVSGYALQSTTAGVMSWGVTELVAGGTGVDLSSTGPGIVRQNTASATFTVAQEADIGALTDNTGGTANTTLQALTDPADLPLTADALRDDLVANLIPELRNNYADLAAQVNAIRTVLRNLKAMA